MNEHELTESHWILLSNISVSPLSESHELHGTDPFDEQLTALMLNDYVDFVGVVGYDDDYYVITPFGMLALEKYRADNVSGDSVDVKFAKFIWDMAKQYIYDCHEYPHEVPEQMYFADALTAWQEQDKKTR